MLRLLFTVEFVYNDSKRKCQLGRRKNRKIQHFL